MMIPDSPQSLIQGGFRSMSHRGAATEVRQNVLHPTDLQRQSGVRRQFRIEEPFFRRRLPAKSAVGSLQGGLGVGVVEWKGGFHGACEKRSCRNLCRARCVRVLTVPMGSSRFLAISSAVAAENTASVRVERSCSESVAHASSQSSH